jgi:hypothetical protein
MKRVCAPEILDSLPADDPRAVASRRDLRLVNALMGNFRWIRRRLEKSARPDDVIIEIGAGDGGLARRICARIPHLAERYHALDLTACPPQWPAGAVWHRMDVWSDGAADLLSGASIVLANHVLHHFDDAQLARLGSLLRQCRAFIASESCRRELHVWQGRLLFPLLHRITRHDLVVSVRAGFRGTELAQALGLDAGWQCLVSESPLGAYRIAAFRTT